MEKSTNLKPWKYHRLKIQTNSKISVSNMATHNKFIYRNFFILSNLCGTSVKQKQMEIYHQSFRHTSTNLSDFTITIYVTIFVTECLKMYGYMNYFSFSMYMYKYMCGSWCSNPAPCAFGNSTIHVRIELIPFTVSRVFD